MTEGTNEAETARWRAAHAMYGEAERAEEREDHEEALAAYRKVLEAVDGLSGPGPLALYLYSANGAAVLHHTRGEDDESQALVEHVVSRHFANAPDEAAEPVANMAFLAARLRHRAGSSLPALELLQSLAERYGEPRFDDHRRTAALAGCESALILDALGRRAEAEARYAEVARRLGDPHDRELRRLLSRAMACRAYLMSERGANEECVAICREIVERFGGSKEPETAEHADWAFEVLRYQQDGSRRRLRRRP